MSRSMRRAARIPTARLITRTTTISTTSRMRSTITSAAPVARRADRSRRPFPTFAHCTDVTVCHRQAQRRARGRVVWRPNDRLVAPPTDDCVATIERRLRPERSEGRLGSPKVSASPGQLRRQDRAETRRQPLLVPCGLAEPTRNDSRRAVEEHARSFPRRRELASWADAVEAAPLRLEV